MAAILQMLGDFPKVCDILDILSFVARAHDDAATSDIPRPSGLPMEKAHTRLLDWPVSLRKLLVTTAVSSFEAEKTTKDPGE